MAFRREPLDVDDPLLSFRPVPSKDKKPRHTAITPARQRAFILALAETGIVTHAARQIGASTEALYRLRNKAGADEFSAAWDEALDRGVRQLEDTALARAIEGEERMVVSGGKLLGYETRYNDNLIMFFLRNRRGERYAPDWRSIRPGHPLYEKIKAEVIAAYRAQEDEDEESSVEALDAFFEGLKQRRLANEALLAELDAEEAEEGAEAQARHRVRASVVEAEVDVEEDEGDEEGE
jgi:hypothetical protein